MRNKNRHQVESIFHAALALGGSERISFLTEKCSGDSALLSEVESLLSAFESGSGFLEDPAFDLGMNLLAEESEQDLTGEKIGFYEIKEKLGGGGMGDVYLAEDTRLNRRVALKFLKKTFTGDKWAKRQFMKEAQAAAMLEHPNICAVHSIEEVGGHNFIAMQYIEGKTLAQVVAEKRLPLETALSVAHQIVSAVAVAHSHGIIHRDIKPGNIMITSEGLVKVLDFGLAKVVEQQQKRADENISQFSQNGLIFGTVAYMSPEQLRGERLDYRSDIFSVGIVFREMLEGKNPFRRSSQAETIAAILSDELPAETENGIPDTVDATVRKCLNKSKDKRFDSAAELQLEIENLRDGVTVASASNSVARIYRYAAFILLFVLALGAALFLYLRSGKIPRLAVLPIANESRQTDKDYISEGLTASLIEKFSHLSGLKVIAQPIVSQYKSQPVDPRSVGAELDVDVLLLGKIIQKESGLALQVDLLSAADGTALFTKEYAVDEARLIEIHQNLASQIIAELTPSLSEDEKKRLEKRQTNDPEAYALYLTGRYWWNRRDDPKNMEKAIDFFTKATEADPAYALAWAGLADSYALSNTSSFERVMTATDAARNAKAAAKEAIKIDSNLAPPHVSLGIIKSRYDWDWLGAENDFKKSISLDPEYAPAYFWYSRLLALTGRYDEALAYADKARELEPFSVTSQLNKAHIYFYSRNFDLAEPLYTDVFSRNPGSAKVQNDLAWLYLQTDRTKEAIAIFEKIRRGDYGLAGLGYAYARSGRSNDARRIIGELDRVSKEKPVSAQEKAIVYIGLNEIDTAFEHLTRACNERYAALPQLLAHDPLTDPLRTDARFAELLRCVNLLPN